MKTLQLTTKAYCAGVVLDAKGICVQSAPILKWMIGKGEKWIRNHCSKHHIRIQEVAETDSKGRAV